MDSRVERLEQDVGSLMTGQQQVIEKITELFDKLAALTDQSTKQPVREQAESSQNQQRANVGRFNGNGGSQQSGSNCSYTPKLVKLDFPRFNGGEDPTSWLCRADQFFDFHETPEGERVALASFHLEGDAQLWYQLLKQEMGVISWETFKEGLHSRYGPTQFYDFFGELTKLQQTGSVREYQTQFEKLLAKAGSLSQTQQVSCFVSGLKESIKVDVLAGRPNSLSAAISLARLYEARNLSQRRAINSEVKKGEPLNRSAATNRPTLPVRKMSPAEIAERREKGLCYNCNEKFSSGHRCRKLFVIEACREDDDSDVIMEEEDVVEDGVEARPEISFHAISGTHAPETMRVNGSIGHIATIVLVDSGSTHNFINAMLAKKVGLQPIMGGRFEVVVASGEKLSSPGKCTGVKLTLQGFPIFVDFYLLPLEGYDIVLGTQWLRTLGPIIWDFSRLQMRFQVNGKDVTLQGLSAPKDKVVEDSKLNWKHLLLSTYEKEMLALVLAVQKWRPYLLGRQFIVRTDQRSLQYLWSQRISTAAQQRWLYKLMGFDFIIEYKKGKENVVADALSRRGENDGETGELTALSHPIPNWVEAIKEEVTSNPTLKELVQRVEEGEALGPWKLQDGVLFYKERIYLDEDSPLVMEIIAQFHNSTHEGYQKTIHRIRSNFYWKGMRRQIKEFVKNCDTCQRHKVENLTPAGLLQPLPIPNRVWEDISMDFVEGLPLSKGKSTIMVVVDRFSKYAHFVPISHPYTAAGVAQTYFEHIFKLHGMPRKIVCDRDPIFTSGFWSELFRLNGTEFNYSSAYHPQTDGQSEVVNRTMEMYLRCFTSSQPKDWVKWLTWAEYCYNTSWHSAIKKTPFEVVYGRTPPTLLSYIQGTAKVASVEEELLSRDQMVKELRVNLKEAQERMKKVSLNRPCHIRSPLHLRSSDRNKKGQIKLKPKL
ncbi:hypothetical protein F0562_017771 [Nyssa sinensis]|uniref:Integrase catalytic domain-containing protein n=1 Tax=Nyssa sinensis TaxID=561372 RepID=A0A5J4ZIY9_9ASTE|nr:hypothetical protein F0562_017771 [Nyssa sinensis]